MIITGFNIKYSENILRFASFKDIINLYNKKKGLSMNKKLSVVLFMFLALILLPTSLSFAQGLPVEVNVDVPVEVDSFVPAGDEIEYDSATENYEIRYEPVIDMTKVWQAYQALRTQYGAIIDTVQMTGNFEVVTTFDSKVSIDETKISPAIVEEAFKDGDSSGTFAVLFHVEEVTVTDKMLSIKFALNDDVLGSAINALNERPEILKGKTPEGFIQLPQANFEPNATVVTANSSISGLMKLLSRATCQSKLTEPMPTAASECFQPGTVLGTINYSPNPVVEDELTMRGAKVYHEFSYGTTTVTPPQEIIDMLPNPYLIKNGETATPKVITQMIVEDTNGTWEFKGWDKESQVVSNFEDVIFKGVWEFTPAKRAYVTYEFISEDGSLTLPASVMDLLPLGYMETIGVTVTVDTPNPQMITVEDGKWVFVKWEKDSQVVTENGAHFVGIWRFEKKTDPEDPVEPADPVKPDKPVDPVKPSEPPKAEKTLPNTGESSQTPFVALSLIVGGLGIYLLKNKKQYN